MPYHLYAELGNTNLHLGLWRGEWLHESRLPAQTDDWVTALRDLVAGAGLANDTCRSALICASTPRRQAVVEGIQRALKVTPRVLGWDVTLDMPVAYDDPSTFGQDRLLAAFAASELAGRPCVVMDAGTCITCEAVTEAGEVLPIAIALGFEASLKALLAAAPHLADARLSLSAEDGLAGIVPPARSTSESISVGLICQLQGLSQFHHASALIALDVEAAPLLTTGGDGDFLTHLLAPVARHEPLLALEGLRLLDQRDS